MLDWFLIHFSVYTTKLKTKTHVPILIISDSCRPDEENNLMLLLSVILKSKQLEMKELLETAVRHFFLFVQ